MAKQMIKYLKEEIQKVKTLENKQKSTEIETIALQENEGKLKDKLKYYIKKNRNFEEQLK